MSDLLKRLKTSGSIKYASILSESELFNDKDVVKTDIPIINIALSGKIDGGITPGLIFLAGPSKTFKSLSGLMMVKAYMTANKDAVCLYYDSEFGITPEYIKSNGIDADRVLHIPIEHLEQLKFDISKRLEEIKRGDKVIIFIDSIGNLASKKEAEDALEEKTATDMTRARTLKSLFRIITPHFTTKDIPCIAINHTYQEMALYPKTIMSGGSGPLYSANQVFIYSKSQEKEGTDIIGWNFNITVEKSRFVKERTKLSFLVTYDGGINKWSGLMDIALESGHVVKPSNGWYSRVNTETGEVEEKKWRLNDTNSKDFWESIVDNDAFKAFITKKYAVSNNAMLSEEPVVGVEDYVD